MSTTVEKQQFILLFNVEVSRACLSSLQSAKNEASVIFHLVHVPITKFRWGFFKTKNLMCTCKVRLYLPPPNNLTCMFLQGSHLFICKFFAPIERVKHNLHLKLCHATNMSPKLYLPLSKTIYLSKFDLASLPYIIQLRNDNTFRCFCFKVDESFSQISFFLYDPTSRT